jgi:type II secretory pathway pseudopilin PulG
VTSLREMRSRWPLGIGSTIVLVVLVLLFLPHIDRGKFQAEASSAVGNLRNIALAQGEFRTQQGCFATKLTQLPGLNWNPSNVYRGYTYALFSDTSDSSCANTYIVTATPNVTRRGYWYFSINETGIVRYEKTSPPRRDSPILQ